MLCLDLGAGARSPENFMPMGNAHGSAIYPLASVADGSADVIRASHVLEHFATAEIDAVLADWVRALKPGGELRIAVPDFTKIAEGYLAGAKMPTESFVMGGQTAVDDYHKALFDEERLKKAMARAGLMLIRRWDSELPDCASLPISLNLAGTKPHMPEIAVSAVMSVPRLGFMDNMFAAVEALPSLGVKLRRHTGAYWGQCIERVIEEALRDDDDIDAILTIDYDSVFSRADVSTLMQLMCCHPEIDAIAGVQAGRGTASGRLFTMTGEDGAGLTQVPADTFDGDLTKVSTAHFGLTLIRADKIAALPKPWFADIPAPDGSWNDGRTDADIAFWRKWAAAGNSLYIANRVPIGHLELTVLWPAPPGPDTKPLTQPVGEWRSTGKPKEAWQ
jgi:hypothetical protein